MFYIICTGKIHDWNFTATFSHPFFVVFRGRNPSKTFSTIREQCFATTECLQMDRKIKKWSHKCYAWRRSQTPVHGHNRQQHWAHTWHGLVRQTIDEVANRLQIIGRPKPEIQSKYQGQLLKGIVLLHDNACPHTAAHTVETLQKLYYEVLAHPL